MSAVPPPRPVPRPEGRGPFHIECRPATRTASLPARHRGAVGLQRDYADPPADAATLLSAKNSRKMGQKRRGAAVAARASRAGSNRRTLQLGAAMLRMDVLRIAEGETDVDPPHP